MTIVGICGVPVSVVVIVTVPLVTSSVTVVSVVHGRLLGLQVNVVVTVVVDRGTSKEQAAEIVLATQVDRAEGVGLPGRLAGVATSPSGEAVPELPIEVVIEGVDKLLEVGSTFTGARLLRPVLRAR